MYAAGHELQLIYAFNPGPSLPKEIPLNHLLAFL